MGTTTATTAYRSTVRIHPANLRPGDVLCGEDGRPFTTVTGLPFMDGGAVRMMTACGAGVDFPRGTSALILARTTNER